VRCWLAAGCRCSASSTFDTRLVLCRAAGEMNSPPRQDFWWGGWDSNPRPRDYESPALTG
jgi:hypothetical protein